MDTPVTGTPRLLLRVEGLVVLLASLFAYDAIGASWILFAALLLAPDIGLLGYLAGPRMGAAAYNAVHTYLAPGILGAMAWFANQPQLWPMCLIWLAHIGMDRTFGLGLKYPEAFRLTHLGTVGRGAPTA